MSSDFTKKYKRPKQKCLNTTNPETTTSRFRRSDTGNKTPEAAVPLQAKDSEWVDILQTNQIDCLRSSSGICDEEEVLQLVECEDGPEMKPLAILFPGLLEKDPQTLRGMLNKAMSTTEVTRHLVDLGQKANFTFMKKANRLIPPEKKWLETLSENSTSRYSTDTECYSESSTGGHATVQGLNDIVNNSSHMNTLDILSDTNLVNHTANKHKIRNIDEEIKRHRDENAK